VIDRAAYFRRVGWSGPLAVDEPTLARLAAHHTHAIPFENLNPFLGLPVDLDLAVLERKLVRGRRGGYCFEQNAVFADILRQIGFNVTGLAARVLWGRPEAPVGPRSHMLLRVDLADGPCILDVGFGSTTLTGVLRLVPDIVQETTHEPFRLLRRADHWRMEARVAGNWLALYRFDPEPAYPADYAVTNYFTATHPTSPFVNGLMLARPVEGGRLALANRDFTIHHLGGPSEKRRLETPAEIIDVLETKFDLDTAGLPRLEQRLATLP
jgi:N-hydroxyarylamine O-acetyltransferase